MDRKKWILLAVGVVLLIGLLVAAVMIGRWATSGKDGPPFTPNTKSTAGSEDPEETGSTVATGGSEGTESTEPAGTEDTSATKPGTGGNSPSTGGNSPSTGTNPTGGTTEPTQEEEEPTIGVEPDDSTNPGDAHISWDDIPG